MNDNLSLVLYLTVFALSGTLIYIGQKYQKKTMRIIGICLPIIFAALRYGVGVDYFNYVDKIEQLSRTSLKSFITTDYLTTFEPTFYLMALIAGAMQPIQLGYVLFFGFYAALIIIPFYYAIKKINPKYSWFAILAFLLLFYAPSLNTIRQYAAVSIAFYATIDLLLSKAELYPKYRRYILLMLGAFLVHTSSICAVAILPLLAISKHFYKKDFTRNTIYFVLFSAFFFALVGVVINYIQYIPILNHYSYALSDMTSSTPVPNLLIKVIPIIVAAAFFNRCSKNDKLYSLYYLLTFVTLLTTAFGYIIPYGYRIAAYFNIFQIPLLISITDSVEKKNQKITIAILLAYCLAYFIYSSFLRDSYGIFPFEFISFIA